VSKIVLQLYVTGKSANSRRAINNLERICSAELSDYQIEVIDLLQQPHLVQKEKIIATPTVVKKWPPPFRKIIGDLSDKKRVLLGLDVISQAGHEAKDAPQ